MRIVFSSIVLSVSLLANNAYAQRGAVEIGAGAGLSINGNPGSNMVYKGNRMTILNYSGVFNTSFNVHRSISAGIEVRSLELSRKSDVVYPTYLKTTIGGDDRKFVYSKGAISACAIVNGKYNTTMGYFYGGAAVGYGISRHNSQRINTNKESYRAPDGGSGRVLGIQAGYTHGINSLIGLNVEWALRNYTLKYDAGAPEVRPYENLRYNITANTLTVGIRFRIMPKYAPQNDIPPMRGKGRSRKL